MEGYDGLTEEADNVISGFCIAHMGIPMSRELMVFLEECKRPASVMDIKSIITVDEFKSTEKNGRNPHPPLLQDGILATIGLPSLTTM